MKVTALAGGVGGAKLLVGLDRALDERELCAIVNTADDATIYGVHVSPDVDIVTYWLAGIADYERGWGIAGDTFHVVDSLAALGSDSWFRLGDRDLGTCIYRTQRLADGAPLSEVTAEIALQLNLRQRVLPMSNERVATTLRTDDGRTLEFQEYFVKERTVPQIVEVAFEGIDVAEPSPGVLESIRDADIVVVCPSNPIVSIGPIVGLPGLRSELAAHPHVVAVTPIVQGAALKGPADRLLDSLGGESSAAGVARLMADYCDVFVVDESDADQVDKVAAAGVRAVTLDTIMSDHDAAERLGRSLLEL